MTFPSFTPGAADALLFDLGHVVLNVDFEKAIVCWAGHAGCEPAAIVSRFVRDEAYQHHETGTISDEAYFDSLRASLGISITHEQFLEGWNAIFAGEMPDIASLLARAARRLPLYAFSNTNRPHVEYFSKEYADLLSHFRELFLSSTMGLRKPDAEAYDHVVKAIGVPAQRIVFFDDLAENVRGARARGLTAVHVTSSADIANALSALGI
ncbi:MAG: HAD-IA family hydrolase [Bradyrhizobium sp.]|uniref:HAD-IA family hydrolase n=1 Tax=Bradyrhizobium sp. TaxID=376 RepID=UPI0025C3B26C|nr:HAD-IA family hydrolase [Bradyrhizobium sp.]MBI5262020.1 HAD-IA family hydrolase [Bradyrhizobium sp.]